MLAGQRARGLGSETSKLRFCDVSHGTLGASHWLVSTFLDIWWPLKSSVCSSRSTTSASSDFSRSSSILALHGVLELGVGGVRTLQKNLFSTPFQNSTFEMPRNTLRGTRASEIEDICGGGALRNFEAEVVGTGGTPCTVACRYLLPYLPR
jgi:hypothetical protein